MGATRASLSLLPVGANAGQWTVSGGGTNTLKQTLDTRSSGKGSASGSYAGSAGSGSNGLDVLFWGGHKGDRRIY